MFLLRSTRALPFASALVAVMSSAIGLFAGVKKGLPKRVLALETEGFLAQGLAGLALVAFAVGLASFVRTVEATEAPTTERRPYSMLILALGAVAGVLHMVSAVVLSTGDSLDPPYRMLASGESLALSGLVLTASAVFRAIRRPGVMLLSAAAALVLFARGALVVVHAGFERNSFAVDPADIFWVLTSLMFGLWMIVASISLRAPAVESAT